MPELGKATYVVELNTSQVSKIRGAQKEIDTATTAMNEQLTLFEDKVAQAGTATGEAADEIALASDKVVSSSTKVGTEGAVGWAKFRTSVERAGATSRRASSLLGMGAAYLVVKSGIQTLKDNNAAQLQLAAAIKTTGGVAGVTSQHAMELSKHWESVAGSSRSATNSMVGVLLSFRNIRDVGKGTNAVFDRTVAVVENISAKLGRGLQPTAIAVGKALQDPTKYLSALARTGVTFSKGQIELVKHLDATKGRMAAQKYILSQLEQTYGGAAKAAGDSFAGQLNRAKLQLGEASAKMVSAFIPAFKTATTIITQLGTFLSHHTTLVKNLVLAYVAWKGATILLESALRVAKGTQILWNAAVWMGTRASRAATKAQIEQAAATDGIAASEEGAIGKTALLKSGLKGLAKIGGITIAIALVAYGAHKIAQSILHLQKMADDAFLQPTSATDQSKLGKYYGEQAIAMRKKGMRGMEIEAALYKKLGVPTLAQGINNPQASDIVAAALVYAGGSDARIAAKRREAQTRELAKRIASNTGRDHFHKGGKLGKDKKVVPPKGDPAVVKVTLGLLPEGLIKAYTMAELTKTRTDDIVALKNEEDFLRDYGKRHKLSVANRQKLWDLIVQVNNRLTSARDRVAAALHKTEAAAATAKRKAAAAARKAAATAKRKAAIAERRKEDLQAIADDKKALALIGAPTAHVSEMEQLKREEAADLKTDATLKARIKKAGDHTNIVRRLMGQRVAVARKLAAVRKGITTLEARDKADQATIAKNEALLADGTGVTKKSQDEVLAKELKTYKDDLERLHKRFTAAKGNWHLQASLSNQLVSVTGKLTSIRRSIAENVTANANAKLKIALDKALLSNNQGAIKTAQKKLVASEITAYTAEEDGLKKQLKAKGLTYAQQAQLYDRILSVDNKILALKKKAGVGLSLDQKEMQALLNNQGTFMSEFAGNVFGNTKAGLTLSPTPTGGPSTAGSSTSKHITVNQHNHYEEIPKDRFREAHRLRKATSEALNFGR